MSDQIQVPMPLAGMASDFKSGKSYNIDEYIAQIEPRYRIYNEQISRCISGLTAYAAQQAASGQWNRYSLRRSLRQRHGAGAVLQRTSVSGVPL